LRVIAVLLEALCAQVGPRDTWRDFEACTVDGGALKAGTKVVIGDGGVGREADDSVIVDLFEEKSLMVVCVPCFGGGCARGRKSIAYARMIEEGTLCDWIITINWRSIWQVDHERIFRRRLLWITPEKGCTGVDTCLNE